MRIEMPEKRKKYDREFREGAVRIVEETGKPIAQVARDLGATRASWATGSPGPGRSGRAPRACPRGTWRLFELEGEGTLSRRWPGVIAGCRRTVLDGVDCRGCGSRR